MTEKTTQQPLGVASDLIAELGICGDEFGGSYMQLVWYHGTTNDALKKIQQEGVLFGVRNTPSRCTYLAADLSTAKQYGDVILQVNYNPSGGDNNYCDDCWQMRVYEPIPIKNITILTRDVNA